MSVDEEYTHTEGLVYISDVDECYGECFRELVERIRSEIHGDLLSLEEHLHELSQIKNENFLIRNSVWLIHYSCLLDIASNPQLDYYLSGNAVPQGTEIFVSIDGNCEEITVANRYDLTEESSRHEIKRALGDHYGTRITPVVSRELLSVQIRTYLNTANPARGPSGRGHIEGWKQSVETRLNT